MENSDLSFNQKLSLFRNGLSSDPYFYWVTFLKYKKPLLVFPILIALLVLIISKNIQPIYQSTAKLIIDTQDQKIINIEQVYSDNQSNINSQNFINTQKEIIKSNEVLNRLFVNEDFKNKLEKLFSDYKPTLFYKAISIFKLRNKTDDVFYKDYIKKNLNVSTNRENNIISLSFDSKSKEFAKYVLDNILLTYLEYDIDQKIQVTTYANFKIQERLQELKSNLEQSEAILQNYKKEKKLIDLGDIKNLKTEEIKSISSRILKAEKELQELQNNLQQISLNSDDYIELSNLKAIKESADVDKILANLETNSNTIDSLKLVYTENHPKLDKALKTEENLLNKLKETVDQTIASKAYELANLQGFIDLSNLELEQARQELQNLEIDDLEMQKFNREVELNKRIYESFLERLKETTEAKELQTPNASILDEPTFPSTQISPRISLITFFSYIFTLTLLYGLVTYFETFRNAISDPSVLEENGFDLINIIPKTSAKKGYHLPMNFLEKNSDKFSESILSLQAILLSKYNNSKVFMITSPVSGEGKTTISLNLALSLSTKFKVLFLETDFRRPSLMKSLNLDYRDGIIELFNGLTNFSKAKFNIHSTKLDLLAAGNPSKFNKVIDESRLIEFIKVLKTNYDFIIIDTAPVLPVADTLTISKIADTAILVVRSDYTKIAGLVNARSKLTSIGVKNDRISTVMNFFDTENANYYNYSNYGSYYKSYYNYS